jgi:hypothetical protein
VALTDHRRSRLTTASTLLSSRQIEGALAAFDLAERVGFDPDECSAGRWYCWMLLGNFELAWQESDAIESRGRPDPNRLWDGSGFNGKRVLLRCLHGYGDAIQFVRYASDIRQNAKYLIVQTHPEMVSLFRYAHAVDQVITWGADAEDQGVAYDHEIEIMELPRAFRTSVSTIPQVCPYIGVSPEKLERSYEHVFETGRLKVGFTWRSSSYDESRSIPLKQLLDVLLPMPIQLFSLQRGQARQELKCIECSRIVDTAEHSMEIVDTATDLANLDLIVTVDTMVAHLAGALARPVWVLLPQKADWRWMLGRTDSPWYPTMRLFRQKAPGDWKSVCSQLSSELKRMMT